MVDESIPLIIEKSTAVGEKNYFFIESKTEANNVENKKI